jgi:modulator of FtsH protease HflC
MNKVFTKTKQNIKALIAKVFTETKQNIKALIVMVVIFLLFSSSLFKIYEGEQASAFFFGKATRDYTTSGLHIKFPLESIKKVNKRLILHTARALTLQEETKKKLLIDYFCLYKIDNSKTYLTKVVTKEKAQHRIDDNLGSDVAAVIGRSAFEDIVTNKRQDILDTIKFLSNRGLKDIDLSLRFVSFNRVELPDENKAAVFGDMIADRNKISAGYKAEGQRIKDSIMSYADFQAAQIVAEANKEASQIMGSADSLRMNMLNKAYNKSKELFKMYNEVETFKKSYSKNTEWILTPENLIVKPNF